MFCNNTNYEHEECFASSLAFLTIGAFVVWLCCNIKHCFSREDQSEEKPPTYQALVNQEIIEPIPQQEDRVYPSTPPPNYTNI